MTWSKRVLLACGLVFTGQLLFLSLSSSASSERPCEVLRRWAHAFDGQRPTLDRLATFDRAHRIAIFNTVTPAVRSSLVQEQLRRYREHPGLSQTQRALIDEGRALATPAFYAKDPAAKAAFQSFWTHAQTSFTSLDQRRPWFDIGAVAVQPDTKLANPSGVDGEYANCSCNIALNGCSGGRVCQTDSCTWQGQGCGLGGGEPCDGRCQ